MTINIIHRDVFPFIVMLMIELMRGADLNKEHEKLKKVRRVDIYVQGDVCLQSKRKFIGTE